MQSNSSWLPNTPIDSGSPWFSNPDTYLNHLSPAEANQFEIARNVYLAVLGATIWDVLVYLPDDIRILRRSFSVVTSCFVLARVLSIAYLLLSVISLTHPILHCQAMQVALGIVCLCLMASTSFLFLRRAQAVYSDNRLVQWLFSVLWLATSGLVVTLCIGIRADHIPGTEYCAPYAIRSYVSISEFSPAIFDTLVFFAISYKIASTHNTFDRGITWGTLVSGKALPRLSRAILQGGQEYYLIVFGFNIVAGCFLFAPSIPSAYRPMMAIVADALSTSMACRVLRNIKKLDYENQRLTLPIISDNNFVRHAVSEKTTDQNSLHPGVSDTPHL